MLHALLVLAAETAEESEPDKTLFYVLGGGLAVFAVLLAAVGLTKADFPSTDGQARGVMGLTALLVVGAMAAAVITG
ncbi:MAG: hypothetical protein HZB46_13430 [Solirubrobacterales bacterium]|nr:hypothetical protein [Solirubrobacterales bacterium]